MRAAHAPKLHHGKVWLNDLKLLPALHAGSHLFNAEGWMHPRVGSREVGKKFFRLLGLVKCQMGSLNQGTRYSF